MCVDQCQCSIERCASLKYSTVICRKIGGLGRMVACLVPCQSRDHPFLDAEKCQHTVCPDAAGLGNKLGDVISADEANARALQYSVVVFTCAHTHGALHSYYVVGAVLRAVRCTTSIRRCPQLLPRGVISFNIATTRPHGCIFF